VVAILGLIMQQIQPETMEKLVVDLWKDSKFSKGLDGFVEDANKKQSVKSLIALVDGLMAVYLNILYATVLSCNRLPTLIERLWCLSAQKNIFHLWSGNHECPVVESSLWMCPTSSHRFIHQAHFLS
jgi:hypothetical protein